jgi:hypothetical protein
MTTEQVERLADGILARARDLAARRPDEGRVSGTLNRL